jgi:hypothetical protein
LLDQQSINLSNFLDLKVLAQKNGSIHNLAHLLEQLAYYRNRQTNVVPFFDPGLPFYHREMLKTQ